jgi:4-hydroxy 2-oxovalerate aldolase
VRRAARRSDRDHVEDYSAPSAPAEVVPQSPDQLEPSSCGGSLLTAAEEVVRPYLTRWPKLDRNAIVQGWAGVYSSFLLHAERAADRYRVPAHEILAQCGERGLVGGQEDMIIDVALELAAQRS